MNRPPDSTRIDASIVIPFIIFTGVWGSTWIVIRDQIGTVPPQWSVAYRFMIAAVAMALVAKWKGQSLKLDRGGLFAAHLLRSAAKDTVDKGTNAVITFTQHGQLRFVDPGGTGVPVRTLLALIDDIATNG